MLYLDNAATTPMSQTALEKFNEVSRTLWGNPSALHQHGLRAAGVMQDCKKTLLALLGARGGELIFCGCGTESDNLALLGAAARHRRGRVITTALEHPAVLEPMRLLEERGFEVVRLRWGGSPEAFLAALAEALTPETVLVSIMAVNNETGLILPVKEACALTKKASLQALFHTDATQAFGKTEFNVAELGVDLCTVSAHKLCGPQGIGALYIREGVRLTPQLLGGKQQGGLRSGTEPVALCAAFAAAAEEACSTREQRYAAARSFREQLEKRLEGSAVRLLKLPQASPFIVSLALPRVPSEVLLRYLDEQGIRVSAGSACAKGKTGAATTELIGENKNYTVRVSLWDQDAPQADVLADALLAAQKRFALQVNRRGR